MINFTRDRDGPQTIMGWGYARRSPTRITTTEQLGRAMLRVARSGAPKHVLESPDIVALATYSPNRWRHPFALAMLAAVPDFTEFSATLETLAAQDGFTGSVLVTAGDERLLAAAYGYANRACRAPCTLDTRFDTASVTKLFTAVAVLQQIERGAFALDTSAIGYLGLAGTTISPDVTAYHLLTHTSGIADDADER